MIYFKHVPLYLIILSTDLSIFSLLDHLCSCHIFLFPDVMNAMKRRNTHKGLIREISHCNMQYE